MIMGDWDKLLDCAALVDCGCQVLVWKDGSGAEVKYCPMHKAAPEMKAACKTLVNSEGRGGMLDKDEIFKAFDLAKQALALMEGDQS